jgi:geranylgeranyl reductase family protein
VSSDRTGTRDGGRVGVGSLAPMPPSSSRPVDVLVVGAGPAGAAAAAVLAHAGRDVVVIDKARFPRDKICGDGLTTSALRELDALGLDPSDVASWVDVADVVVRSPSGRIVRFDLPHDGRFAAVARRADLDDALVQLARRAGAVVHEGCALEALSITADATAIAEVDGLGALQARHVVAADGMWSPTRRLLGLAVDGYRGEWHALRQYVTDVSPRAARELVVWFEPDLLPGYMWSFPIGGGLANVGFGIQRDGSYRVGDMGALWRELLCRPHVRELLGPDARPEGPHRAWPIPARVGELPLAHGPVLFVGDAAAATDPMTGEGIGQALLTGRWAAEAILAGATASATTIAATPTPTPTPTTTTESIAERYRAKVRAELVVDHQLAQRLLGVLRHRRGVRVAVGMAGSTAWTRRNFARWLFEDYPRALLLTPSRWHRRMLHGPGAYRRVAPTSVPTSASTSDASVG